MAKKALTQNEKKFAFLKAGGMNQSKAVEKAYPDMAPASARAYATRLMQKESVQNEVAIYKQLFRDKFLQQAFQNWQKILEQKPEGKIGWNEFIRANEKTFEISQLKDDKIQANFRNNKFIQQFYGKETQSKKDK
jgi:hypothetical protein